MEWFGIVALLLLLCYSAYPGKVKRLETKVKRLEKKQRGVAYMSKLINDLVGKQCIIRSEFIFSFAEKTELSCKIIDADDEWIKICYTEKKDKFAFLPQPMAAPSLLKKEIVQIPLKDEIPERQICLVYDSQHPMGAAARELKNTIVSGRG